MKKIFLLLAVAMMTATMNAQNAIELARQQEQLNKMHMKMLNAKPSKDAKRQTKELKKEGWTVPAGEPSIEQQITRSQLYGMEMMSSLDGIVQKRYIMETGQATSGSYNTGYAAARAAAQTEIAAMLETELVAAFSQKMDNTQMNTRNAVTRDDFQQRMKSIVDQSLNNAIPVLAIYRTLDNGNVQVQVRIAFDKQELTAKLRQAVRQQMDKDGEELEEMVDDVMKKKY